MLNLNTLHFSLFETSSISVSCNASKSRNSLTKFYFLPLFALFQVLNICNFFPFVVFFHWVRLYARKGCAFFFLTFWPCLIVFQPNNTLQPSTIGPQSGKISPFLPCEDMPQFGAFFAIAENYTYKILSLQFGPFLRVLLGIFTPFKLFKIIVV